MRRETVTLPSKKGEPFWEIARFFPEQGRWSVDAYLALDTNHLIEFTDGTLEVLPMPSQSHQFIVRFLFRLLDAFVLTHNLGTVFFAPMRIRVSQSKFREPDLLFSFKENSMRQHEQYWDGADLVMEVVSPDDPNRDLIIKRQDYAEANIPEYWIVNPLNKTVTVLTLVDGAYVEDQVGQIGMTVQSRLLDGFEVDVKAVFDAPQ